LNTAGGYSAKYIKFICYTTAKEKPSSSRHIPNARFLNGGFRKTKPPFFLG